ncbi:MAG: alpha/beta hydrolase [Acidobacteria bacterium]|nr:alpha/beta hydrolase [Acidobacteriota bacterium]
MAASRMAVRAQPRPITPPHYPIIYVRGYAATMGEIEETVGTPYMGFNLGSTKVRQGHEDDKPVRFIFESPLIRLMKDETYTDTYEDGDFVDEDQRVDSRSVWIFRYYEEDSKSFGDGKKDSIEDYAKKLSKFILRVRKQVCQGNAEELAKFKVYLVAHSMGGLICRTYLQNVARKRHYVDKVFTYATPHGGIEIEGLNVPDLGAIDKLHVRNFNHDYMKQYLRLSKSARVTSLDGAFCPNRFFCFVGTNYKDYDAFFGLSKRVTGPAGDGLVMMENAVVDDAPRAFAHRSHSGPFGIVNSEEGYQNLRRFLFGDVRVDACLAVDEITLPRAVQKEKKAGKRIRARYNIDASAKVRGGGIYLSERRVRNESAIREKYEDLVEEKKPVYLFSGFLLKSAKTKARDTALAFALEIAIEVPLFEVNRKFWFDEHFEGETLLNETVTLHLRWSGDQPTLRYGLRTHVGSGHAFKSVALSDPDEDGRRLCEIPLGFREGSKTPPRPGFRGRLLLTTSPWNT